MTAHFPLGLSTLKPSHKKLARSIADLVYPDDEVYVSEWPNFLSQFDVLTEVYNFSITAVDSNEVSTSFVNLKPIFVNISFDCNNKIAAYLDEFNELFDSGEKFIGVTQPISVGFPSANYTPFFITEIDIDSCNVYAKDIQYYSTNKVVIKGYTFHKTSKIKPVDFYEEEKEVE